MVNFIKTIQKRFKIGKEVQSKDCSNTELIEIYNKMRGEWKLIPPDEPNYDLARKVFLDFNEFNQRNLDEIHLLYLKFIPKSLLPYPKNYIKCAYYIFLESLKKERDHKLFNAVQEVGMSLFTYYPDFKKYQENLKNKSMWDDLVFKENNPKEAFKKIYGVYQITKEEYDRSPSSTEATDEKIMHDFGILPKIEGDVDFGEILKNS